jgi:hypothetical protein
VLAVFQGKWPRDGGRGQFPCQQLHPVSLYCSGFLKLFGFACILQSQFSSTVKTCVTPIVAAVQVFCPYPSYFKVCCDLRFLSETTQPSNPSYKIHASSLVTLGNYLGKGFKSKLNVNSPPIVGLNRLCGLVVRVPGYRSRGPVRFSSLPGLEPRLERGPLSLVSTIVELLGR